MSYHVPFAYRNRPAGPIYIGFEEPVSIQRRKGRFNWAGFTGLLLALISPLTLFLLSPLALLVCLTGLRRAPRGMATFGTVLALAGSTVLSLAIVGMVHKRTEYRAHQEALLVAVENRQMTAETREVLEEATVGFRDFRQAHDRHLPDLSEGMLMAVQYRDAWDRELFYEPIDEGCLLRSAGPDGQFHTPDDITTEMAGIPGGPPVQ